MGFARSRDETLRGARAVEREGPRGTPSEPRGKPRKAPRNPDLEHALPQRPSVIPSSTERRGQPTEWVLTSGCTAKARGGRSDRPSSTSCTRWVPQMSAPDACLSQSIELKRRSGTSPFDTTSELGMREGLNPRVSIDFEIAKSRTPEISHFRTLDPTEPPADLPTTTHKHCIHPELT